MPAACPTPGSGPAILLGEKLAHVREKKELEDGEQMISLDQPREEIFLAMVPVRRDRQRCCWRPARKLQSKGMAEGWAIGTEGCSSRERERKRLSRKTEKRGERGPDRDRNEGQQRLGDNRYRRKGAKSEVGCRHFGSCKHEAVTPSPPMLPCRGAGPGALTGGLQL